MREINASEFKAKCLAILDEVAETGETVVVLKRGRAVARLVPPARAGEGPPQARLRDTVVFHDDVVAATGSAWDAEKGKLL